MTTVEWEVLVDRVGGFWPPQMGPDAIGAYFDILEPFTVGQVQAAIDSIARTNTTGKRPPVGLIYDIAQGQEARKRDEPVQPPSRDVLSPTEHRFVMIELGRLQMPEHKRREAAIKSLGFRLTLAELRDLVVDRLTTPEEFDRRIAALKARRPPAAGGRRPQQGRLLGADPEADW